MFQRLKLITFYLHLNTVFLLKSLPRTIDENNHSPLNYASCNLKSFTNMYAYSSIVVYHGFVKYTIVSSIIPILCWIPLYPSFALYLAGYYCILHQPYTLLDTTVSPISPIPQWIPLYPQFQPYTLLDTAFTGA